MRLTTYDLRRIASLVHSAARENAYVSVREEGSRLGDDDPNFERYYRATLEGILEDELRGRHASAYNAPRPLTARECERVAAMIAKPERPRRRDPRSWRRR